MKNNTKGSLMLLLAAIIWGCAFVAQEEATNIQTFTLNGLRFIIGGVVLLPLLAVKRIKKPHRKQPEVGKKLWLGGIVCGIFLAIAANLQQFGIILNAGDTAGSSGKAGFITAMYIVLVPLLGVIVKKTVSPAAICGVAIAVGGLYFISVTGDFAIAVGDIFLLGCALAFALQIICVDYFVKECDGVALSAVQFFVAGTISLLLMLLFDAPQVAQIIKAIPSILYLGILSSGVAYTFQIVGQKYSSDATVASLIMSLESLFALIAACLFYRTYPTVRESIGCVLMALAIFVVQTPFVDRLLYRVFNTKKENL